MAGGKIQAEKWGMSLNPLFVLKVDMPMSLGCPEHILQFSGRLL